MSLWRSARPAAAMQSRDTPSATSPHFEIPTERERQASQNNKKKKVGRSSKQRRRWRSAIHQELLFRYCRPAAGLLAAFQKSIPIRQPITFSSLSLIRPSHVLCPRLLIRERSNSSSGQSSAPVVIHFRLDGGGIGSSLSTTCSTTRVMNLFLEEKSKINGGGGNFERAKMNDLSAPLPF